MAKDASSSLTSLQLMGRSMKLGTSVVSVLEWDSAGNALKVSGATKPADGDAGYAKGCLFVDTDASAGAVLFVNEGSATSADFNAVEASASVLESIQSTSVTIATTGNTDDYVIVPESGTLASIDFSGVDALAAHDTNYVTFSVTNLGQAGAGSTAMLAATDANTTKATGGTALVANGKRSLTLHGTAANLVVVAGDRLRVRYAASGTLANTVTFSVSMLRFAAST
jgi:hypothetical protein